MPFSERRKYPRVTESIPFQLTLGPSVFTAETKNLSCGGALCRLTQPVPLMTKFQVALRLPSSKGFPLESEPVRCTGVVVRQESSRNAGGLTSYLTAIYFSELKASDRRRIAEFVLRTMLAHAHRRP